MLYKKGDILNLYNRSLLTRIGSENPDYLLYYIQPALRSYLQNISDKNLEFQYGEAFSEYYQNLLYDTYHEWGREDHLPSLAGKMQYPSDWRVEDASNSSTVAWFYPQRNYTYIIVQMENLSSNFTLDRYRNAVIQRDVANHKDFPDIEFTNNTISDVEFAGHPGYLLNGTFRPTNLLFVSLRNKVLGAGFL